MKAFALLKLFLSKKKKIIHFVIKWEAEAKAHASEVIQTKFSMQNTSH